MNRLFRVLAVVLAAAFLAASPAQAGHKFIQGVVKDRNGKPVDKAVVSLKPGNVQLVTDREGRFLIDYLRDKNGQRTKLSRKTDYTIEIFKPGYHIQDLKFFYKKGELDLKPFTLVPETIKIEDDGQNLDPALYSDRTTNSGATYEGQ